jgi:PIN domain nuclease of toxin-antitoxin system
LDIVVYDEDQAYSTGFLATQTHPFGLSLGDRACLALALLTKSQVLTADRAWTQINLPVHIQIIR